jgi:hypothetical protein
MDIKELLDEDAFDPGNLFDKEKFNTLVLNREGFSKRDGKAADLLESLLEGGITRAESEEIFTALKETNARELMVEAIRQAPHEREKAIFTAACWESGLDFTPHFLFFVGLATVREYSVALEALTVLQNCSTVDSKILDEALEIAAKADRRNPALLQEVIAHLNARKSAQ